MTVVSWCKRNDYLSFNCFSIRIYKTIKQFLKTQHDPEEKGCSPRRTTFSADAEKDNPSIVNLSMALRYIVQGKPLFISLSSMTNRGLCFLFAFVMKKGCSFVNWIWFVSYYLCKENSDFEDNDCENIKNIIWNQSQRS